VDTWESQARDWPEPKAVCNRNAPLPEPVTVASVPVLGLVRLVEQEPAPVLVLVQLAADPEVTATSAKTGPQLVLL
jgi:hypothetical protein